MNIKVLIIHPYRHKPGGTGADGVRQVIRTHLSHANWDEFDYTVVVPSVSKYVEEYEATGSVHILDLSIRDHLAIRRTRNPAYYVAYTASLLFQVVRLMRYIRHHRIDVVHSHSISYLGGAIAARLMRVPSIIHIHEGVDRFPTLLGRIYTFAMIRVADCIVATANQIATQFANRGGANKLKMIYNGVSVDIFNPQTPPLDLHARYGILSNQLTIGYVGRMHPRKNLLLLIEAFGQVLARIPNAVLLLVAAVDDTICAEYALRVKHRVKALGLESCVVIDEGVVPNIPALYRAMKLTVYPAPIDYFPMAILESLASGVPVVNASEGGPRETFVDGESGRQVPPENPEAIAAAIVELLADPHLLQRMGRNARAHAVKFFNDADFAEQVESLYREVIEASVTRG